MSGHDDRGEPRTAAGEVLREAEEAGRPVRKGSAGRRHHRDGAGEAVTPSPRAQQGSRKDSRKDSREERRKE